MLLLSTRAAMGAGTLDGWGVFRLFLMPLCVSSFAALVKGREFVLIFSPRLDDTLLAVALCAAFLAVVALLKHRGH